MTARNLIPGIALAVTLAILSAALAATATSLLSGEVKIPVSPIMTAILLGILIRNAVALPGAVETGLQFSTSRILQAGIVLLGIRLSLADFATIGLSSLPVIIVCIGVAIFMVSYFSRRMGLSPQLGSLIAVGTSICGATAIVATAPTISAREHEVSYAIACITLFGAIAMLIYPLGAHWLFEGDPRQVGIFLGTAVHDTAQVTGAGMMYANLYQSEETLNIATVTKMVRNLSILIVIPLISITYQRRHMATGQSAAMLSLVPLFIIGFALMSLLRTVGDLGPQAFGILPPEQWHTAVDMLQQTSEICLVVAMAAVGLSTRLKGLQAIGLKPLALGFAAALSVGAVSFTLVYLFY